MAITSVGTGSGLDLESLITKIIDAERLPVKERLDLKETRVTASISALGTLKSTLSDFQASLAKLKNTSNFSTRSAVSSDTTLFSATVAPGTDLSSHSIEVLDMAKAHKLASANFTSSGATVGTGTLTVSVGSSSFDVEIDSSNNSLAGVRDAINDAAGNSGVRASILTVSDGVGGTASKLVLTSDESGADNAISVAVSGDGDGNDADNAGLSRLLTANLTEVDPAQDASITIDGFAVTSSTNTFSDAIEGVSITILKESEDPLVTALPGTLSITADKSSVKANVEGFVANYNALMAIFNTLTDYDAGTKTRGLLSGDASVSVMERRVRSIMSSVVGDAAEGMNSLAFLGISTNRDGTIALDGDELSSAISTRFDDLGALFASDNGIAKRLDGVINEFTTAGGVFVTRNESLQRQLDAIGDQRDAMNLRLEKIEARYRAQFSALDILVGQLQQTGDFLTQQLDATAKIISGNS